MHERTTKVFAKAGLDNVTSTICNPQQRFSAPAGWWCRVRSDMRATTSKA